MTTWRRACTCSYCKGFIRASICTESRFQLTHEDGSKEVAVSSLDLVFPDGDFFVQQERNQQRHNNLPGNLNKGKLWDRVVEELEETCVSKIECMGERGRTMQTLYRVPVIGYKFFTRPEPMESHSNALGAYHGLCNEHDAKFPRIGKKIMSNPSQYMLWEGKFYDTGMMYARKGNKFKAAGPTAAPEQAFVGSGGGVREFTKNVSYRDFGQRAGRHQSFRIQHGETHRYQQQQRQRYHGACQAWTQGDEEEYLEINLGAPRLVTHIGTAGEYPVLCCFPTREDLAARRARASSQGPADEDAPVLSRRGNGIHKNKFAPYIYVLRDEESALAWVTSYEVHYRHHLTNKWTLLAVTAANSDALSEAVLDLRPYFNMRDGLFTQYLRVRPLTHHIKPVMRVSVYGLDAHTSATMAGGVHAPASVLGVAACDGGEVEEEGAYIEYAVVQSCSHAAARYVRDGLHGFYAQGNRRKYEWNEKERGRAWKKQEARRATAERDS